jgi:hypothetical protein
MTKSEPTDLFFKRDSVEFIYKRLQRDLEEREQDVERYLGRMAELMEAPAASSKVVLYATIQQVMSHLQSKEDVKEFLRALMAYREAKDDVESMSLKVKAIEELLDPEGTFSLAKVTFEDLPVYGDSADDRDKTD